MTDASFNTDAESGSVIGSEILLKKLLSAVPVSAKQAVNALMVRKRCHRRAGRNQLCYNCNAHKFPCICSRSHADAQHVCVAVLLLLGVCAMAREALPLHEMRGDTVLMSRTGHHHPHCKKFPLLSVFTLALQAHSGCPACIPCDTATIACDAS